MKITKIEYLEIPQEIIDRGRSAFTPEERECLETFEDNGHDIELENEFGIGSTLSIYSEEFLDYVKSMCVKYNIKCKVIDVTDKYTYSASAFEEFLIKYSSKRKSIEDLILYDTTINDVLDKINKFGIISLTEIDKQILNK